MKTLLLSFAMTLATLPALANDADDYMDRLRVARITLTQAIDIAAKNTGGVAVAAELDKKWSTVIFEVQVVNQGHVYEVQVDAITGMILKVK